MSDSAVVLTGVRLQHFSLLVYTEQPLPTWLFLKKSRTSLNLTVQSRSENALIRLPPRRPGAIRSAVPALDQAARLARLESCKRLLQPTAAQG